MQELFQNEKENGSPSKSVSGNLDGSGRVRLGVERRHVAQLEMRRSVIGRVNLVVAKILGWCGVPSGLLADDAIRRKRS